jgi:hypothetical protein
MKKAYNGFITCSSLLEAVGITVTETLESLTHFIFPFPT